MKNVLCICAHPDDEVLGCGGTLAKHAAAGDHVAVLFMTDGVRSRRSIDNLMAAIEERSRSADKAAIVLGCRVHWVNESAGDQDPFADQHLDGYDFLEVTQAIEAATTGWSPNIIYTHHAGDLNLDHRITHQAVMTAFRPVPGSSVEAIHCFEVPSSTEWGPEPFVPNRFVDIGGIYLEKKIAALNAYRIEMRAFPHARSHMGVMALAQWRGVTAGIEAAEAFMTVRSRA